MFRSFEFTHAVCRRPSKSVVNGLRMSDMGDPDPELLQSQHQTYVEALRSAGLEVTLLNPDEAHPDSMFVEDAALVLDGICFLLRPGAASRRDEAAKLATDAKDAFQSIVSPEIDGFIDGGDILCDEETVYVGLSARTDRAGAGSLELYVRDLGYRLQIAETPKDVLHLKTDSSLLDQETVLSTNRLAASGIWESKRVLIAPEDEPQGANVIRVNDRVIISESAPKTADMLDAAGFTVHPVPNSEAEKIDGGVSCQSLRYRQVT